MTWTKKTVETSLVFHRIKKLIQVWNNMRLIKTLKLALKYKVMSLNISFTYTVEQNVVCFSIDIVQMYM